MVSIFSDKASLLVRHILANPEREWVVRDFVNDLHVGRGWVAAVMDQMRKDGYLVGVKRGRNASAKLDNSLSLLKKWRDEYSVEKNTMNSFYSPDVDILDKLSFELKNRTYAFTMHSGANQTTQHVATSQIHLYFPYQDYDQEVQRVRKKLKLLQLKEGGTIHFLRPYYKNSVFYGKQKAKGMWTVSFAQMYLDLYHYPARGREHADFLLEQLLLTGKPLD